jgi:hypothetical protein
MGGSCCLQGAEGLLYGLKAASLGRDCACPLPLKFYPIPCTSPRAHLCALLCLQGAEGVLYDVKAVSPAPVPSVDLRHMGPMRVSRFWSAVHDALLYADPRAASGGKVRVKATSSP